MNLGSRARRMSQQEHVTVEDLSCKAILSAFGRHWSIWSKKGTGSNLWFLFCLFVCFVVLSHLAAELSWARDIWNGDRESNSKTIAIPRKTMRRTLDQARTVRWAGRDGSHRFKRGACIDESVRWRAHSQTLSMNYVITHGGDKYSLFF